MTLRAGLPSPDDMNHDVLVVGSGPVGLALAARLVRRGRRVLLLESGSCDADKKIQALADADVDPLRHDDMAIATSRQLGGTSNLWGARALPYDPIDFEPRDWINARWPISYTDMAPYLADAVAATASGAPVYEEPFQHDYVGQVYTAAGFAFGADTLERWANEQRAQNIHRRLIHDEASLDIQTGVTVVALRFAENGRVCAIEARDSLNGKAAIIPVAELVLAAGGLETARLLLAAQREAPSRFGGINGPLGRYYQGHIVGEIAQIHFARPELAREFDFRIDGHGSYVRRRIVARAETQRAHRLLNCAFWPVVPKIGHAEHHSAILSMIYLVMRMGPVARLVVAEKIRQMNFTSQDSSISAHLINLIRGAPSAAVFGGSFLAKRFDKRTRLPGIFVRNPAGRYGLCYHSEQSPNPLSRVTLTDQNDRLGLPRLAINLRFAVEDANAILRQHALLDTWLDAAGIARLEYFVPQAERAALILGQAHHGTHQIGIVRMGVDRNEGVVNGWGTSFDSPNLHVATTAMLPTSSQANPTLTAIALALRLADRLSPTT